jgi:colicin import membrane protein
MPEPTPNPPAPQPAPPADPPSPPPTPGDQPGAQIPKVRFDEVNDRMKAAEAELQRLRDAQTKADEDRLQKEKDFEALATKRAGERDEWKGKAETAAERISTLETRLHAIADERAKALPEKLAARVPAADKADAAARLEKIEELEAVLAELPQAPPRPGNGRDPKPAGGATDAKADQAARAADALRFGRRI